ncbi:MAG: hypothetical protein IBX39_08180 [Candidatus Methanoperedenaceae archaeon]|nr:hypothetical protein [Candidatus Methanoperedenaceae archaeon]MDW7727466.1 hypothetical protein [Candidatus Methanoperedens sp.]
MKHKFVIIGASILVVIALVSGCLDKTGGSDATGNIDYSTPQTNNEGGISITVSYLAGITDATAFEIEVTAHQDYNDDFGKNSFLRGAGGKKYQPLSYEGSRGHHAEGILRFPKIDDTRFELVIQDVAGVEERVFTW